MQEFVTAGKRRESKDGTEFTLDGRKFLAHRPPDATVAFASYEVSSRRTNDASKVAKGLDLLLACFSQPDADFLRDRLEDPEDDFEIDQAIDILTWLGEQWSGRPPTSRNGSSSGQVNAGASSTEPAPDAALTL